jgi:predicted MFS family arabinose efflux permease
LTNTGSSISDLWERNESGGPVAVYGLSSTFGPPMALVITGYIGLNAGWRMIFWVLMAMSGAVWILLVVSVPETRHLIILQNKAHRVRRQMRKENLASADSTVDIHASGHKGLHELFAITLTRPFRLFSAPRRDIHSTLGSKVSHSSEWRSVQSLPSACTRFKSNITCDV